MCGSAGRSMSDDYFLEQMRKLRKQQRADERRAAAEAAEIRAASRISPRVEYVQPVVEEEVVVRQFA